MSQTLLRSVLLAGATLLAAPAVAQETEAAQPAEAAMEAAAPAAETAETAMEAVVPAEEAAEAAMPAPFAASEADASKTCELHIWPTENYLGMQSGLLSGFGIVGALANEAVNKDKVVTVKDQMREYLGPDVQLSILESLDAPTLLGLSDQYRVIVQPPTPWNEDLKDNPELKAEVKEMNRKLKKGERLTDSDNACYAELVGANVFYHKAMMYGSNLFAGWQFRKFEGDKVVQKGKGSVKNPLEEFPPKTEEMIEVAKEELRDAYSKDFVEYVEKKVNKKKRSRRR